MNIAEERAHLTRLLDDTRLRALDALKDIDSERVVYRDSGWRVKDLISHIVAWEEEMYTSLEAYANGSEYLLTHCSGDDECNEKFYQKRKDYPVKQIYAEWQAVRDQVKMLVNRLTDEQFTGQMLFPWGARGTVRYLIEHDMIPHQNEHMRHILEAVGS